MDRSAFFGKTIFAVGMFAMLPWVLRAQEPAIEGAGLVRPAANVSAFRMDSESLLRVEFSGRKTWGHVERGAVPEGRLSLPLYAGEHIIAPEGSAIRVTVNSAEKIRRNTGFWRKTGRVIVRAFNPLETNRPAEYCVELSAADLLLSTGEVLPLDARVLRASSAVMVQPRVKPSQEVCSGRRRHAARPQARHQERIGRLGLFVLSWKDFR